MALVDLVASASVSHYALHAAAMYLVAPGRAPAPLLLAKLAEAARDRPELAPSVAHLVDLLHRTHPASLL